MLDYVKNRGIGGLGRMNGVEKGKLGIDGTHDVGGGVDVGRRERLHFLNILYIIPNLGVRLSLGFVPDEGGAGGMYVVGLGGAAGEPAEEGGDGNVLTIVWTSVWGLLVMLSWWRVRRRRVSEASKRRKITSVEDITRVNSFYRDILDYRMIYVTIHIYSSP